MKRMKPNLNVVLSSLRKQNIQRSAGPFKALFFVTFGLFLYCITPLSLPYYVQMCHENYFKTHEQNAVYLSLIISKTVLACLLWTIGGFN